MGAPNKDERDEKTWLVFELTYLGEKTAVSGELEKHILDLFGIKPEQVFIPYRVCVSDGRKTLMNVMEGYCFVEYTLDSREYVLAVRDSPYLKSVMHSKSGYTFSLHTVPNKQLEELKAKLNQMASSSISEGDRVLILKGSYEGVEGVALLVDEDSVCVRISLRSLESIRVFPKFVLSPLGEDFQDE